MTSRARWRWGAFARAGLPVLFLCAAMWTIAYTAVHAWANGTWTATVTMNTHGEAWVDVAFIVAGSIVAAVSLVGIFRRILRGDFRELDP